MLFYLLCLTLNYSLRGPLKHLASSLTIKKIILRKSKNTFKSKNILEVFYLFWSKFVQIDLFPNPLISSD